MKPHRTLLWCVTTTVVLATPVSGVAQQVTGELGAPSATTTIDGKQLPPPAPTFGGEIDVKAANSKPW